MTQGSLECLQCAHQHGLAFGFPPGYAEAVGGRRRWDWMKCIPSLPILRYSCEVMHSAWAQKVLVNVAGALEKSGLKGMKDGWKMVL